jgi:LysM domain
MGRHGNTGQPSLPHPAIYGQNQEIIDQIVPKLRQFCRVGALETVFMTRDALPLAASLRLGVVTTLAACTLVLGQQAQAAPNYPITPQQQATANQVAQAGVPLSALARNAPDSYTVKRGDTLWEISGLFLKSPWRWPELWGMNKNDIRNPHLIYPGQVLYLDKSNGRARLRMGKPLGDMKLSPRVREGSLYDALAAVPMHLLMPFFNEAVIFESADALAKSPRVVATQEGRVMVSRDELAYVRGDLAGQRQFRLFREPLALKDPVTQEVLGYEAAYVGTAEVEEERVERTEPGAKIVPSTIRVTSIRQEAGVGDRLAPMAARDYDASPPHAPSTDMQGHVAGIYGESLTAGQNQIVALNKGARDGLERGHVLALWTAGATVRDVTAEGKPQITLPDERHGLLYVFRVFDKMSYALIMTVKDPVKVGDRFTQP